MDRDNIRGAISQAKRNEGASKFMAIEICAIAAAAGFVEHSWWVFGGILFGSFIAIGISKILAGILCFAISLGWGYIGYAVGGAFCSLSAAIVLAILAFFIGLGVHLSAIQWFLDMSP